VILLLDAVYQGFEGNTGCGMSRGILLGLLLDVGGRIVGVVGGAAGEAVERAD
jgi:hypothetical protein